MCAWRPTATSSSSKLIRIRHWQRTTIFAIGARRRRGIRRALAKDSGCCGVSTPGRGLVDRLSVPAFSVYLFDVDGTLVDSAHDICGTIQTVLAGTDGADRTYEFLRGYIGRPLNRSFSGCISTPHARGNRAAHRGIPPRLSCPRPQFDSRISGCAGSPSKPGRTESYGDNKGNTHHAHDPRKIRALALFRSRSRNGRVSGEAQSGCDLRRADRARRLSRRTACSSGDSAADMEAARRAGVRSCAVTYGYGLREEMLLWQPDFWVSDLRELVG